MSESVEEFFARGGKATIIPSGVSSNPIPFTKRDDNGKPKSLTQAERDIIRRSSLHSHGRQNIRHAKIKIMKDKKVAIGLVVKGKRYGTFYSEESFFKAREEVYSDLGLSDFNDWKR